MPLYSFKCQKCNYTFTVLQRFDDPEPYCPECGSVKTDKQVTAPGGFEFKGGGFYHTDFKNKSNA